jgi:hypothetical protein
VPSSRKAETESRAGRDTQGKGGADDHRTGGPLLPVPLPAPPVEEEETLSESEAAGERRRDHGVAPAEPDLAGPAGQESKHELAPESEQEVRDESVHCGDPLMAVVRCRSSRLDSRMLRTLTS